MIVKASAITNLTDARYFAAKEAAFLGFNLEPGTVGYLDPMYMKAIREWVEGPEIVGEFSTAPVSVVREAADFFGLDAVQLDVSYIDALDELSGRKVLLAIPACRGAAEAEALMARTEGKVAFFLLDFSSCGQLANDNAWAPLCRRYPILLHLDGPAATLHQLLTTLEPAGLSLSGGEEERVGVKSFDEIEAIFDWIQGAG